MSIFGNEYSNVGKWKFVWVLNFYNVGGKSLNVNIRLQRVDVLVVVLKFFICFFDLVQFDYVC